MNFFLSLQINIRYNHLPWLPLVLISHAHLFPKTNKSGTLYKIDNHEYSIPLLKGMFFTSLGCLLKESGPLEHSNSAAVTPFSRKMPCRKSHVTFFFAYFVWGVAISRQLQDVRGYYGVYMAVTGPGGGTQILFGRGCAAEASKPVPIFKGHFGGKGYPLLGIFSQESDVFVTKWAKISSINSKITKVGGMFRDFSAQNRTHC